jgi:hypothetical protein
MPPLAGLKNEPPRLRSMNSIARALVTTGVASSTSSWVTSTVQVKMGIRNIVMPGARMLKMVVRKLTEPRIDEAPTSSRATIHRSTPRLLPWAPIPSDSGAYWVQPASAGPPSR